jgi:tetratricopeptide (TPR) repeat protein
MARPGPHGTPGKATAANTATHSIPPDLPADLMANQIAAAEARAASGDYAGAREIAHQARRTDDLDFRPVYLLAQLAELEGDDAEAVRQLAQVLYLAPDYIPACLDTAAHLERLGDPNRAMRHRRAARRLLEAQADEQALQPPYQNLRVGTLKTYLDELLNAADAEQDMLGSEAEQAAPTQVK